MTVVTLILLTVTSPKRTALPLLFSLRSSNQPMSEAASTVVLWRHLSLSKLQGCVSNPSTRDVLLREKNQNVQRNREAAPVKDAQKKIDTSWSSWPPHKTLSLGSIPTAFLQAVLYCSIINKFITGHFPNLRFRQQSHHVAPHHGTMGLCGSSTIFTSGGGVCRSPAAGCASQETSRCRPAEVRTIQHISTYLPRLRCQLRGF